MRRPMPAALLAPALATTVKLLCGAGSRWVDCRPEPHQRVYCANHASHLDALVIWAALPPALRTRTRPVAAADYWRSGIRHWLATRVFRAILIERALPIESGNADSSPEARRAQARAAVELTHRQMGDDSLILFPEGTRGTGEGLGPFKPGIYHLCQLRPGLEIVPVALHNLGRVLPRGEFAPIPLLASVTFGPPTRLGEAEDKDAFLSRLRSTVEELCRS